MCGIVEVEASAVVSDPDATFSCVRQPWTSSCLGISGTLIPPEQLIATVCVS
jgi:hypothetical protein